MDGRGRRMDKVFIARALTGARRHLSQRRCRWPCRTRRHLSAAGILPRAGGFIGRLAIAPKWVWLAGTAPAKAVDMIANAARLTHPSAGHTSAIAWEAIASPSSFALRNLWPARPTATAEDKTFGAMIGENRAVGFATKKPVEAIQPRGSISLCTTAAVRFVASNPRIFTTVSDRTVSIR
jgi:hypothetical protein